MATDQCVRDLGSAIVSCTKAMIKAHCLDDVTDNTTKPIVITLSRHDEAPSVSQEL